MIIRKAIEADFFSILSLVKGLAEFVGAPEKVTNSVEQMKKEKDFFQCLIAENEEKEIVGIATYFFAYYSWVGKSLYLDDLYVRESCRGQKAGSKLLEGIFEVARNEDCKRVRWQVNTWNTSAIDFYKRCGADIDTHSYICTFDAKEILEFKT